MKPTGKIKRILTIIWFSVLAIILFLLLEQYTKTRDNKLIVAVWFYSVLFISIYLLVFLVTFAIKYYTQSFKGFIATIKMYQIKGKERPIESHVVFKPPVTRFKIVNKFFNWLYDKLRGVFKLAYRKKSFESFWKWFTSPSLNKKTYIIMYIVVFSLFALWCFYPQLIRLLQR